MLFFLLQGLLRLKVPGSILSTSDLASTASPSQLAILQILPWLLLGFSFCFPAYPPCTYRETVLTALHCECPHWPAAMPPSIPRLISFSPSHEVMLSPSLSPLATPSLCVHGADDCTGLGSAGVECPSFCAVLFFFPRGSSMPVVCIGIASCSDIPQRGYAPCCLCVHQVTIVYVASTL